jgi:hypothetical protein
MVVALLFWVCEEDWTHFFRSLNCGMIYQQIVALRELAGAKTYLLSWNGEVEIRRQSMNTTHGYEEDQVSDYTRVMMTYPIFPPLVEDETAYNALS